MIKANEIYNLRDGEVEVPYLMYLENIRESWQAQHKMDIRDWKNICFIHGCHMLRGYFSKTDYEKNLPHNKYKTYRVKKYIDKGWVTCFFDARGMRGQTSKYKLTQKGLKMMSTLYNQTIGKTMLYTSERVNPLVKNKYKKESIDYMISDDDFNND